MKKKIEKDLFITEIEEDIKNDNLKKLWDKYGAYFVGSMVLILLVTISIEVYAYFKTKSNYETVNQYVAALNMDAGGQNEQAMKAFRGMVDNNGIVGQTALIEEVNILFGENKSEEAIAKLEAIIANDDVSDEISFVARMILASKYVDSKSTQEVKKLLEPLLINNNPWYESASELLAISYLKTGNKSKAVEIFENIAAQSMNETTKTRALDMAAVLR